MRPNSPSELQTDPVVSDTARSLARWGIVGYRCGIAVAAVSLLVGAWFSALSPEPVWIRLTSLVVLGIAPATVAYTIGRLLAWSLGIASMVYDPVAFRLNLMYQTLVGIAVTVRGFLVLFLRGCYRAAQPLVPPMLVCTKLTLYYFSTASAFCMPALTAVASLSTKMTAVLFRGAQRYASLLRYRRNISIIIGRSAFMLVTLPIRLAARILIAVMPQQSYQA